MLKRQKGNCFEYSILLCSLLIGAGYDAYVVSGYATREVCLADESREICPLLKKKEEVVVPPFLYSFKHQQKHCKAWIMILVSPPEPVILVELLSSLSSLSSIHFNTYYMTSYEVTG